MNERIDHAAEARKILNEIPDTAGNATHQAWCTEALVHAQLAVAEQLRIGNLIALSVKQPLSNDAEVWMSSWEETLNEDGQITSFELRHEIAAALGLSNE